ncbi:MAG: hypothetical protein HOO96_41500 [Polyangiaceae bacterium]|nr:hypothetical protein [Polyangiaceae bacterium]
MSFKAKTPLMIAFATLTMSIAAEASASFFCINTGPMKGHCFYSGQGMSCECGGACQDASSWNCNPAVHIGNRSGRRSAPVCAEVPACEAAESAAASTESTESTEAPQSESDEE